MDPTAIIPVKSFTTAKERLSDHLSSARRADLARATALHVIHVTIDSGFNTIVVTDDSEVADLAHRHGARHVPDPGNGLNAAAEAGIAAVEGPWVVLHADLPLLDRPALRGTSQVLDRGHHLIAPSRDGGTNLLGGKGDFHFSYGPASFHQHLGLIGRDPVTILIDAATATEVDTIEDLIAAANRPEGAWLLPFLS